MDIRQIEYFCRVCEYKRLSAAARELFISEQALSKSIASMERELGFALFFRTSHGLELTSAGASMYEKALETLAAMKGFQSAAYQIGAGLNKESISLGCYEGFLGGENASFSVRYMAQFISEHPECALEIFEGPNEQIYHRVSKGALDLGVYVGEIPPRCSGSQIARIKVDIVASRKNPLSKKSEVTFADLNGQHVLQTRGKNSYIDDILKQSRNEGAEPIACQIVVSPEVGLEFVYENAGIIFLDRKYQHKIDSRRAVLLPLITDSSMVSPNVSIIWREDLELSSVHRQLIDLLKSRVATRNEQTRNQFSPRN